MQTGYFTSATSAASGVYAALRVSLAVAATAIALFAAPPAWAQQTQSPFISNLDQTTAGLTMFTTSSDRFAQSFTPSTDYSSLLYATLNLGLQSSDVSTSDTVHLYVYSDGEGTSLNGADLNSDQPTSEVADLGAVSVNSTTAANYTFSSSSIVSLMGGQIYWLVLQDDANSNAGWSYTTSSTYTGPATINSDAASGSSPDAGNSWLINGLTYTDPNTNQTVPFGAQLFEVGTLSDDMPEPCSLLLFAGGAIGVAASLLPHSQRRSRTGSQGAS